VHNRLEGIQAPAAAKVEPSSNHCSDSGVSIGPCLAACARPLAAWCGDSLEELRLGGNRLVSLEALRGCHRLRVVDVGRNMLTSLQVTSLVIGEQGG